MVFIDMKYIIKEERLGGLMKRYLDNTYGDLTCKVSPDEVTWYKEGSPIARVSKEYKSYLRLEKNSFEGILNMFSLEWDDETDEMLRKLIIPYLTFDGGSMAIPILQDLGFMNQITSIALPNRF
jgi:hypothetical protein